ncbi:NADH dehydrogenase [ubiquinone] 1 alpha subcomplex subunit 5 [Coccinella septempunctata]|uniref:NADH dehydrogenase [ubiquinone] 1 alpha subcomplex subunit 5 n=1 Tax=Coccinella septempunctata TaxID=41139 RepID=UPI001D07191B|nr:NADH dehydrogenase [ubiquinone] 1 alpha subcomplex subunit 5 [Coccinella septempunctata]
MANILKKTTGLTGLKVSQNPHHVLGVLYSKILNALTKMPQDAAYRKYTEDIVNHRSNIVKNTPNVADIEKQIGCGQVEELIVQAENELILARKMITWNPWSPLVQKPPATQWAWPPAKPAN